MYNTMQVAHNSKLVLEGCRPRCMHSAACRTSIRTVGQYRSQSRRVRSSIARAGDPEHDETPVAPPPAAAAQPQQEQQQQQKQQAPASAAVPTVQEQQQVVVPTQQQSSQQQLTQQQTPSRQAQQPQPQLQQQRISPAPQPPSQQQQRAATPSPPRSQQPSWLQLLLAGLQRTPATLVAFLLGGLVSVALLFGWAKGNPMRRNQPYSFSMSFREASKLDVGTPVRMKGVQIGTVTKVVLGPAAITAFAEVPDCGNIIPRSSRVDINLLGLAADPWIDITPPAGCMVRKEHGPHHPECKKDGLIVCDGGHIQGSQGGSTDFMMKFFLSQHDRTRVKVGEAWYHSKTSSSSS